MSDKRTNTLELFWWDVINMSGCEIESVYIVADDKSHSCRKMMKYMHLLHPLLEAEYRYTILRPYFEDE